MQNQRIEGYMFGSKIHSGGFGQVYRGRNERLDIEVAIKVVSSSKLRNPKERKQLEVEINILSTLRHPNIIQFVEHFATNDHQFIVTELATGGDLLDYVSGKTLTEEEARFIFRQIVSGIEFCHMNGLYHRDLKLENFVVLGRLVKIIDFGLAKSYTDDQFDLLKTNCGSLKYIDPELIRQKPYAGEVADTWSLGVILFHLLSGSNPFEGCEEVSLLLKAVMNKSYRLPQRLSDDAKDLLRRLLEPKVQNRLSLHELKCHRWFLGADVCRYVDSQFYIDQIFSSRFKYNQIVEGRLEALEKMLYEDTEGMSKRAIILSGLPCKLFYDYRLSLFQFINEKFTKDLLQPPKPTFNYLEKFSKPAAQAALVRTLEKLNIDLPPATQEWVLGFCVSSDILEVIKKILLWFEKIGVKVDVVNPQNFQFACWKVVKGHLYPSRFDISIFSNIDRCLLQLRNRSLPILYFVGLSKSLMHLVAE